MLLPTKRLSADRSLIALGARILSILSEPKTVSRVWDEMAHPAVDVGARSPLTFDWFVLALDFLYAVNAIELNQGRVHKRSAL
jgi:hypothetical protein